MMFRKIGVGVTVFGCGWILMGLEIIGGRMLAPYFGSGIWVWGSVISVFLAALSVGYFLGGIMSQRFPSGRALASIIAAAALFLLPVALWHRSAGEWFASFDIHERWGSLLAATSLFFIPSLLLGMVSPYSVHLIARNVATVGTSAGTLYAISTAGSFLGCLLTAFYFILWIGIKHILYLSAGLLLLLAVWLYCVWQLAPSLEKQE